MVQKAKQPEIPQDVLSCFYEAVQHNQTQDIHAARPLVDSFFSPRDIDDYQKSHILDNKPPAVQQYFTRFSSAELYLQGKDFFQKKGLIAKENSDGVQLRPTEFLVQLFNILADPNHAYGNIEFHQLERILLELARHDQGAPSPTSPLIWERVLLLGSLDPNVQMSTHPDFTQHFEAWTKDALHQLTFDWTNGVVSFPALSLEQIAMQTQLPQFLLEQGAKEIAHTMSCYSMGRNPTLDARTPLEALGLTLLWRQKEGGYTLEKQGRSITYSTELRTIDMRHNPNEALQLVRAFYDIQDYEMAARIWDEALLSQTYIKSYHGRYAHEWTLILHEMRKRQLGKSLQTPIQNYEFYTSYGKEMRPFSQLIGRVPLIMPMGFRDSEFGGGEDFQNHMMAVSYVDGPDWSVESVSRLEDPLKKAYAMYALSTIQEALNVQGKEIPNIPLELRVIIDPAALKNVDTDGLPSLADVGEQSQQARMAVASLFERNFPPSAMQYRTILGFEEGDKDRSHMNGRARNVFIDLEETIQKDGIVSDRMLVHEWTHVATASWCDLEGPYDFLVEGIAMWIEESFRRLDNPGFSYIRNPSQYTRQQFTGEFSRPRTEDPDELALEHKDYLLGLAAWKNLEKKLGRPATLALAHAMTDKADEIDEQFGTSRKDKANAVNEVFKQVTGYSPHDWLEKIALGL